MPTVPQLLSYYAGYSTDDEVRLALAAGSRGERLRRWYHRLSGDVDPRDFIPVSAGTRVLDFGCGAAPYLRYFRARGAHISGAEIAPAVVTACRGAGLDVVLIEDLDRIPFADGEFDVVYLMQVIEHIARPHQFLAELRRVLKPAGEVYLAMPNARSVWRRVFGADWVAGWFAPFHVFVYGVPAIRALAQAHRFQVVRSWSITPDSWLRLNLKAALYRGNNRLDAAPRTWLDLPLVRLPLALLLRLAEALIRERDCLVVHLKKC